MPPPMPAVVAMPLSNKDYDKLAECRYDLFQGRRLTAHDSDRVMEQIYDWVRSGHINKPEFYYLVEMVSHNIGFGR